MRIRFRILQRTATAALAITLATLATACTADTAPYTANTPTASATTLEPSSTPVGPATVTAPTSETAAIAAANRSLLGYYDATFASAHAGGTGLATVQRWVTGAALDNERVLADYLQTKQYRLDGTATGWTLSTAKSTATTETTATGSRIRFGAVQLVGCAQSNNHPVGDGAPSWTTKGKQFPTRWTAVYDTSSRHWFLTKSLSLAGKGDAPRCE